MPLNFCLPIGGSRNLATTGRGTLGRITKIKRCGRIRVPRPIDRPEYLQKRRARFNWGVEGKNHAMDLLAPKDNRPNNRNPRRFIGRSPGRCIQHSVYEMSITVCHKHHRGGDGGMAITHKVHYGGLIRLMCFLPHRPTSRQEPHGKNHEGCAV